MMQPIVSVTPGISALFVYEDRDRFGVAIRITVTVNGWTIERGGALIADLRGAVVTSPASAADIVTMLTAPVPLVRFVATDTDHMIDSEHLLSPFIFEPGARQSILARLWGEFSEALLDGNVLAANEAGVKKATPLLMLILARMEREGLLTRKDVGHE